MNLNKQPIDPNPEHQTKTTRAINWFVLAALVVIAIGIGIFLKWSFQDEKILEVKNSPFPVRTIRDHPTSGGVIILNTDYCKYQEIEGNLRVSYVSDTREVFLPIAKERGPVGCQKVEVPILIPSDIPPDTYRIKFRVTYDLNPIKKNVEVNFESQPVQVDPTVPTNKR